MTGAEKAQLGQCGICGHKTALGPWSTEQIAEVLADTGIEASEFEDWCDDCFVENITGGDVREAARLLGGRTLQLRNPSVAFRVLLGACA